MQQFIFNLEKYIWSLPFILFVMFTHIYFTFKLKFPQKYSISGIFLSLKSSSNEGISSFKVLMTILAATLGIGNIVGVATAIYIGGIGSVFWIFVSGFFAIATKYAETYLALENRKRVKDGYVGGTMYVLRDRLNLKLFAYIFAVLILASSLGVGSMIQSNSISECINYNYNIDKRILAVVISGICGYIIFGNEKKVANVSSILVPVATIIYTFLCCYVLYYFRYNFIDSLSNILKEAFNLKSIMTGAGYSGFILALREGLSKGLFSNEAGMGTSPLFNVNVSGNDNIEESKIAASSVFIDTVFMCTFTGIILVMSGMLQISSSPIELVNKTFEIVPFGKLLLTISLVIFALSTIPSWAMYANQAVKFVFNRNTTIMKVYKICYIFFIFLGALSHNDIVWCISSIANACIMIPNIIMMFKLKDEINIRYKK